MLSLKNFILNFSIFGGEIGIKILILVSMIVIFVLDIKVLEGMFNVTG
jgi:hypothetical protein